MLPTRSLEGIRVLDLSRLLPGPFASMILRDLGATVDKVEDPKGGDYLRTMPPHAPDGVNAVFHVLNRGKRSVVCDLKSDAGRETFLRLVEDYDVLIESFRPGVMDKLGVGYEVLRERNPGLVYCAITGYGQDGPDAHRAGHDLNYLARAGVLSFSGPPDGPPQVPGVQVADIGGGALYAVIGILAALHERDRSNDGRFVDISMCEGAASFALFGFACRSMGLARGQDMLMGGIAPYRTYTTKDGGAVALASLEPKFWIGFCTAVGRTPGLQALAPGAHQPALMAELEALFAARTTEEWRAFAAEHDCCIEVVPDAADVTQDPQHVARGLFEEREGVTHLRTPVAAMAEGLAPTQGQHTDAILEEAGLDADARAALRETGAIR